MHSISLPSIRAQAGAVQEWSLSVLVLGIRQPHVRGRQLQHGVDEAGVLGVAVVVHLGAHKVILPLQPVGVVGGRGRVAPCPPAVEFQRCPQDVLLRLGALPHRNHPVHAWHVTHAGEKRILGSLQLTFMSLLEVTRVTLGLDLGKGLQLVWKGIFNSTQNKAQYGNCPKTTKILLILSLIHKTLSGKKNITYGLAKRNKALLIFGEPFNSQGLSILDKLPTKSFCRFSK